MSRCDGDWIDLRDMGKNGAPGRSRTFDLRIKAGGFWDLRLILMGFVLFIWVF